MTGWRYTAAFLSVWLLLLAVPIFLVVVIDPYQVFHRTFLPRVFFYKENERYQIPGLVKHYLGEATGTDSVVIGTSLSANFLEENIKQTLGWDAVNLSMRGSTLAERSFVMERAIETGHVRHVIFEINPIDFREGVNDPRNDADFPAYLYSSHLQDKGRYLFNRTVVTQALALFRQCYPELENALVASVWPVLNVNGWHDGLHHWIAWMETLEQPAAFQDYSTQENRVRLKQQLDAAKKARAPFMGDWRRDYPFYVVQKNVVAVMRAHPDVTFYIWFPPVNNLRYALEPTMDMTNMAVEMRRYLVKALADEPNVRLFGLDGELSITGDLSNYMDTQHFTMRIQQWVLESIAQGHYQLTGDTVDDYASRLTNNILQADIAVAQSSEVPGAGTYPSAEIAPAAETAPPQGH